MFLCNKRREALKFWRTKRASLENIIREKITLKVIKKIFALKV